jgi:2-polyprenyl-3-methyl-5-hydroxy-6-metoxy-1,4-benzoquinol methylase
VSWYEHYFDGLATDVWRQSVAAEQTQAEVDFLIKHLRLGKGQCVLDIPCADGRLATPLAKKGLRVTGVDLSKYCLDAARADAGNLPIVYEHADMRKLQYHNQFDGAFCLGNSFGYFETAGTQAFLAGVAEALKPGGHFILDTCLAAETLFTVGGSKEWVEVNGILMLMENDYDCAQGRLTSRFKFISSSTTEEHETHHWIYTAAEIVRLCEQAGFQTKALYGSVDEEPFVIGSERLLLYMEKPQARP